LLKTHSCGELNKKHIGTSVILAGWVDRRRDHGGLTFIDLRDREGVVQVVFNPETSPDSHETASALRNEYVVSVEGEVAPRPSGTENLKLPTGEIEVIARKTTILNPSKTPPFYINEDIEIDESLRLKYRYLDLRRPRMREKLQFRSQAVKFIRDFLDREGFVEVETPILIKSTPEGARDYLVPSRLYPGQFYALPQSPQQLKQLLMVAGLEKYFQIAKCFRDEDTRADRQPEFTQLDLEMSFVEENDILNLIEELLTSLVEKLKPEMRLIKPFPRLSYTEVMDRYGTDKPDLRFVLEIGDLTDLAAQTDFEVFRSAVDQGGRVKGICIAGGGGLSRGQLDELNNMVKGLGGGGLLTISLGGSAENLDDLTMEAVKSAAAKYLTLEQVKEISRRLGAKGGDLLLVVAGSSHLVNLALSELRQEMSKRLDLAEPDLLAFAFVVDFPLLAKVEKTERWESMHHPFTAPRDEDAALLDSAPAKARGRHYDLICNGYELGGGSIRICNAEVQRKVFRLLGYHDDEINDRFRHMLEAFEYGAPPHGGIALGIDRIIMLLAGGETIREVIAFPKNQNAADLTLNAPSPVTEEQLSELHLRLREEE